MNYQILQSILVLLVALENRAGGDDFRKAIGEMKSATEKLMKFF